MRLIQYPEVDCALEIIELEHTAWPDSTEEEQFPSAPDTYVTSFVWLEDEIAVCHVGIRRSYLFHKGEKYLAYGLSEVVTHPDYQNRGIASETIKKAAEYIAAQNPDISIFTCEKSKVDFYERGGWEKVLGACFVGGTKEKPFRSDSLNLITMMRFFSPKGKKHRHDFENTDIIFELGENQLW